MIHLIADSGSTKAAWQLMDGRQVLETITTAGLNPVHLSKEAIRQSLATEVLPLLAGKEVNRVFFYGAGCGAGKQQQQMRDAMAEVFGSVEIFIGSDLLGAARALLGKRAGVVCILGTGSNSCQFDGHRITVSIPPLGYVLGDEGSGAHIGKEVMKRFLRGSLGKALSESFQEYCGMNESQLLDRVYRQPQASRFLAGLTRFVGAHQDDGTMKELVAGCFEDYFTAFIHPYHLNKQATLHFTGSVAFHFQNILRQVASSHHLQVAEVVASPIEKLTAYHVEAT